MANDPQRAKARAIFGPGFFENSKAQPDPKNAAVALQKRANARPIPTYKVGGQVKKADQDFSKPLREALTKAAMKGTPAMKDGGPSDEFTAKRVAARMKAGNYKDGGKVDDRLKRKKEDIESDYRKALAKGKDADVAKAKYDQRMADAADDYAKWTKADRTQTKAAEAAAEKNLTNVRRYGAPKKAEQDKVTVTRAAAAPADTSAASSVIKASAPSLNAKLGTVSAAKPASKPTVRSAPKPVVRSAKRVADKVAAPAATTSEKPSMAAAFERAQGASRPAAITSTGKAPRLLSASTQGATAPRRPLFGEDGIIAGTSSDKTRAAKLEAMRAAAEAPGASRLAKDRYETAKRTNMYAKGGEVGKYAAGGAGKVRKGMMKGK